MGLFRFLESREFGGVPRLAGALVVLGTSGCYEETLVARVIVLDPADGTELHKRTRKGLAGPVRVAPTPQGTDDVLAWGSEDRIELRSGGEWDSLEMVYSHFILGPTMGDALPWVYTATETRAAAWAPPDPTARSDVMTHVNPQDMVATDWDEDGDVDLIVSYSMDGAWLLPWEDGGFGDARPLHEDLGLDQEIAVGDLDGDGRDDLVHHVWGDQYVLYAGAGGVIEETFGMRVDVKPEEAFLTDVDGDGRLDVVLIGEGGLQVLDNPGGRTLELGAAIPDLLPRAMVVDIDQDGDPDFVGQPPRDDHDTWGSELLVVRNEAGTLQPPEPLFDVGESVVSLAAGTDADGSLWLAAGTFGHELTPKQPEVRN